MNIDDDLCAPKPDAELVATMKYRIVPPVGGRLGSASAGSGRKKGCTQPPTVGRKPGIPNMWTPEYREYLEAKAQPFELLADICAGNEIADGDAMRKPTAAERYQAAVVLGKKLLPDLQAAAISAPQLAALGAQSVDEPKMFDVARSVAFILASGIDAS